MLELDLEFQLHVNSLNQCASQFPILIRRKLMLAPVFEISIERRFKCVNAHQTVMKAQKNSCGFAFAFFSGESAVQELHCRVEFAAGERKNPD